MDKRLETIDKCTVLIEGLPTACALTSCGVAEIKKHVTEANNDTFPTIFVILPAPRSRG